MSKSLCFVSGYSPSKNLNPLCNRATAKTHISENEGCDSLSGDIACKKCVEALYQMFKTGYEYKLGEVIFPDVKW
jgi:hypothetical protein